MELPRRARGDELLKPGEFTALRQRVRLLSPQHDLATVVVHAFDHRTRILPFIFMDKLMPPAGVRAVGAALVDAGLSKTRVVNQEWNPHFRPSRAEVFGRRPDMLMVSTMDVHLTPAHALMADAWRGAAGDPESRPLIIVGGPTPRYSPHLVFNYSADRPGGADLAVTGEEPTLLALLEVLLATRGAGESMRSAFRRARDSGTLDAIPGLVYSRGQREGVAEELVDTGVQRLLGDFDELPDTALGFRLLEPPSRGATLAAQPLPTARVRRHVAFASLVLTAGCKFNCDYCPIPAYNQRKFRTKSPARIADEFLRLHLEFGFKYFFGADDNFFNDKARTLEVVDAINRVDHQGRRLGSMIKWYTEVTVHDTLALKDHLPEIRKAGGRRLWMGIEDMTATLVKKGQSVDKTTEVFRLLRQNDIQPMPMMMHHDGQPLYTHGKPYGLINQLATLRREGAITMQVLMATPAPGTRFHDEPYNRGEVYARVGGRKVEPHMMDANYVVASTHPRPWVKQFNLLLAYLYFYNPVWMLVAWWRLGWKRSRKTLAAQLVGIAGTWATVYRTLPWALRLMVGRIQYAKGVPASPVPVRMAGAVSPGLAVLNVSAPRRGNPEPHPEPAEAPAAMSA